jgi:hypothetical protein
MRERRVNARRAASVIRMQAEVVVEDESLSVCMAWPKSVEEE